MDDVLFSFPTEVYVPDLSPVYTSMLMLAIVRSNAYLHKIGLTRAQWRRPLDG
jgi:hypothetical protein